MYNYKMVQIIWYDATHQYEMDMDDLDDDEPLALCNSVGYLVKETDTAYIIAQEISMTNTKIGFRHLFAIPKGMVAEPIGILKSTKEVE